MLPNIKKLLASSMHNGYTTTQRQLAFGRANIKTREFGMKNFLVTMSLAWSALLFSAAPAKADSLDMLASRMSSNLDYLYDLSIRVGDRGYELNDLANLRLASSNFLFRKDYNYFLALENSLRLSSSSWVFLNSYRYESFRYMDVQNDFSIISSIMRQPVPQPFPRPVPQPFPRPQPVRRVITVTNEGSGGTTGGDRGAACERANERALTGLAEVCGNQRGLLLNSSGGTCDCRKHPGSRDDYSCKVTAVGSCEIN
jgi:hypothetical protein